MRALLAHVNQTWPGVPIWMRKLHRVGPVGGASCKCSSLFSFPTVLETDLEESRKQMIGDIQDKVTLVHKRNLVISLQTLEFIKFDKCKIKSRSIWEYLNSISEICGKVGRVVNKWFILSKSVPPFFRSYFFLFSITDAEFRCYDSS